MIIRFKDKRKGYALIISVGILALLVIIAIAFVINMRWELQVAQNYVASTKAKYLAEAGIAHSNTLLKDDARNNFVYIDNVSISGEQSLGEGVYTVDIKDEQEMVNINNANADLLRNLPGLDAALANNIISARPFETKEEIMTATGIGETEYDNIKDYITVTSWQDPACSNRSPININTASKDVLKAVLRQVIGSQPKANSLADEIITRRQSDPFDSWSEFNDFIDTVSTSPPLNNTERDNVKDNANPNRTKPAQYTTEFCFHSGGYYLIVSTGEVREGATKISERKIKTIVKIYDIWSETTKDDFKDVWLNDATMEEDLDDGDMEWVTYKDNCPVRSDESWNAGTHDTIPDSLKLGYWDDFNEEVINWTADHCNDWTAWYYGWGDAHVSSGRLYGGGGWTVTNMGYQDPHPCTVLNVRRYDISGRNSTISMDGTSGSNAKKFLYGGRAGTNYDATARSKVSGGLYNLQLERWPTMDISPYTFTPFPTRMTLTIVNNRVTGFLSSTGVIGGTKMRSDSTAWANGELVRQYQGWVDNVRAIAGKKSGNTWNGRYISSALNLSSPVELCQVVGTVTIPETADEDSETITLQFRQSSPTDVIQYIAYFSTEDTPSAGTEPYYSETPVLEDVYVTYMDTTQVLYWRE